MARFRNDGEESDYLLKKEMAGQSPAKFLRRCAEA
jgi:hypothetical protein